MGVPGAAQPPAKGVPGGGGVPYVGGGVPYVGAEGGTGGRATVEPHEGQKAAPGGIGRPQKAQKEAATIAGTGASANNGGPPPSPRAPGDAAWFPGPH